MIAVLGALVEFVPITVDGVLDVLPFLGLLALVVGLEEVAAVPLVAVAVLPPYHADPLPVGRVTGVLLRYQYSLLKPHRVIKRRLTCLK